MTSKNQKKTKKPQAGRPLKGDQKRVRVSFTLLPRSVEWLRREAGKRGKSRSEVLDLAVEHFQDGLAEEGAEKARRFPISIPRKAVAEFGRKHRIKKLSLFGSILTDRFGPESDVDVLVEFEEGQVPGLMTLIAMEQELSRIFAGRKIDLKTPQELSRYFREEVAERSETLYAA